MDKEIYNYTFNKENSTFQFESIGPKGRIKKFVSYTFSDKLDDGTTILNVGFGDLEDDNYNFNDTVISNNADRDKVLATVARTAFDIMNLYENTGVIAAGSTAARTRLYQMGISANKGTIDEYFEIKGLTDSGWEPFRKGVNYLGLLATKKIKT